MKNYIQDGRYIDVVAPSGGLTGGAFYFISADLFGVVSKTVLETETTTIDTMGVYSLPKATGAAWVQGDKLYWDASASKFTKTATANTPAGVAALAAASGDTTGYVKLGGGAPAEVATPVAGVADGYKIARGEAALDGSNPTPVATGLATVIAFVATLKGTAAPGVGTSVLTANIAGAAGNVDVYAWKPTSNADPTLVASTGTESFYWTAIGT
jgi:predicted RecA/RadA family phage recombinase